MKIKHIIFFFLLASSVSAHHKIYSPRVEEGRQSLEWRGHFDIDERESMLAIEIPERAGSLKKLCEVLDNRNLTEFSYRMSGNSTAQIFMGVEVHGIQDHFQLIKQFEKVGIKCLDLSSDELSAKSNLEIISSFEDLIKLSSKKKEIELKYELERNVSLIKFTEGKIDIGFNELALPFGIIFGSSFGVI